MSSRDVELSQAYWLRPRLGCALLSRNWDGAQPPALRLESDGLRISRVRPADPAFVGRFWGCYEREDGWIVFCQEARRHPQIDFERNPVQVVGPFNRWGADGPAEHWRLRPRALKDGSALWECAVARERLGCGPEGTTFKFVSADWQWLGVLTGAPNRTYDQAGNANYLFDPLRSGRHVFKFEVENGRGLDQKARVSLNGGEARPVAPGLSYFDVATAAPLGARVETSRPGYSRFSIETKWTVFRLFAPRARSATVEVFQDPGGHGSEVHAMALQEDDVTWEVWVAGNLHGWYYYLRVDGENDGPTACFDAQRALLDPWALATAGPAGPGIVIDAERLPRRSPDGAFRTPALRDLVIVEGHVRDLTRRAPAALGDAERLGFSGLTKWVAQEGSYLRELGANALELLPVAQSDAVAREEYHWGYMSTNFFSPCAHYGLEPARASQVQELAELVAECHRRGIAVILDVVYNHVGQPAHLMFLDKVYFFHLEDNGVLANWSGCGNTLRAESAMSRRLIIESLTHLLETYDVDGFRFDLADLLTIEVLCEVERALRAVKPSVILIAEPWSFRGSVAWQLHATGFAFWNDAFREFLPEYVWGRGNYDGLRYFLAGSLDHLSAWPAQSINYVESHDDRCWLDRITENPNRDGTNPTQRDIQRTHLAIAIMMCAIGVPMLAAGQDFLRSKKGASNTYRRGDLNELDYERLRKFAATHEYCRQWIRFRASEWGDLLRLEARPSPRYVRCFGCEGLSAAAVLFNADSSRGNRQILFAANPHLQSVSLALKGLPGAGWRQLAGRGAFSMQGESRGRLSDDGQWLSLDPIDCGLWVRAG